MFCEEKITEVLYGHTEWEEYWPRYFLDCHYELAYHVEEGESLYLLTDHFVITLNVKGATLSEKPLVLKDNEWVDEAAIEEGTPWRELEATLFVGQRLMEVERDDRNYLLHFDDFTMKLVPYEQGQLQLGLYDPDNLPVLGCDRHLQRHCDCGGKGEILMDFVTDFQVRCKNCKKATWAEMNLYQAIEAWNRGETPVLLETTKEQFLRRIEEPIQRIEISDSELLCYEGDSCTATQIELRFSDCSYFLSSYKVSDSRSELQLRRRDIVIHREEQRKIIAKKGNIRFLTEKHRGNKDELWFALDDAYLRILSDGHMVRGELVPYDPDGNSYISERKRLFDEECDRN